MSKTCKWLAQLQTTPRGRDTRHRHTHDRKNTAKVHQTSLSLNHQVDCKTRKETENHTLNKNLQEGHSHEHDCL